MGTEPKQEHVLDLVYCSRRWPILGIQFEVSGPRCTNLVGIRANRLPFFRQERRHLVASSLRRTRLPFGRRDI